MGLPYLTVLAIVLAATLAATGPRAVRVVLAPLRSASRRSSAPARRFSWSIKRIKGSSSGDGRWGGTSDFQFLTPAAERRPR
jgi:hypothetical protein